MWKEGYVTIPSVACDGCTQRLDATTLQMVRADGHSARYCPACKGIYDAWVAVCQSEEDRLNRLLDLFIETSRQSVHLAFVPQDLPRTTRVPGQLVLG